MKLGIKLKDYFFNAFRELFIYHHNSLEFRAKLYALLISANHEFNECELDIVMKAGMEIYKDEGRANAMVLATKEFVEKVIENNGLDIDLLVDDIIADVKIYPRYIKKINVKKLVKIIECTKDEETRIYQQRMIEFLEQLIIDYGPKS